jgi:hypothetical protein
VNSKPAQAVNMVLIGIDLICRYVLHIANVASLTIYANDFSKSCMGGISTLRNRGFG